MVAPTPNREMAGEAVAEVATVVLAEIPTVTETGITVATEATVGTSIVLAEVAVINRNREL